MPRFYFHQVTHGERIDDIEGAEYHDIGEALADAVVNAREIMAERLLQGQEPDGSHFEIVDERGRLIISLPFDNVADGHSFDVEGNPRTERAAE